MRPSRTMIVAAALVLTFLLGLPALAWGQVSPEARPYTPAEVVGLPNDSDGETILLQGEAIGESLHSDGEHRWVNLLGDGTAVAVYMTGEESEMVEHWGRHATFGDSVRVVGVLNRWCEQHAGEFDVHAEQVLIVSEGQGRDTEPRPWKAIVGLVLVVIGFAEYRYFRYTREVRPSKNR